MYEYDLKNDVALACKILEISKSELLNKLGLSYMTFSRWESDKNIIELSDSMISFYDYVFKENIVINKIKEMFQRDSLNEGEKILFHGSKFGLDGKISINRSKDSNDFGKGFYCGDNFEQSAAFVLGFDRSSVYIIKFKDTNLKKVAFGVEKDWMLAIAYYRGKLEMYKNSKVLKKIIDKIDFADYIIAPIADNRMFEIIDEFTNGDITDIQCEHSLSATNLGFQYVFKTDKALSNVKVVEHCYLCNKEKKHYEKIRNDEYKICMDKVKLAKKDYRNKGKYIEDLLKGSYYEKN